MKVTILLIIINVLVYLSYMVGSSDINKMCNKGVIDIFKQSFTHIDITHLLTNMYTLYTFKTLEQTYGSANFSKLVLYIVALNTILNIVVTKLVDTKCSIGFSGILFGLIIWQYFKTKEISQLNIMTAIALIVQPSLQNPKASLMGHFIGGLTGFLLAFIL